MNNARKWQLGIVVGFTAGTLGIQYNSVAAKTKQVLNWTESTELATADISQATDTLSFNVLLNTQEGLYRLDAKGTPQPALAQKATISDDGLVYTFWLKPDTKWSNGQTVTARDFVYSWQRTVDPRTGSQDAFYLNQIQNAKDINAGQKSLDSLGIKALGKYKLEVHLTQPVPYFKKLLAWPLFFPQNEKSVQKYGKAYGTSSQKVVSNGPYKLTHWDPSDSSWQLVKNGHYWDKKKVKLQRINETVVKDPQTGLNLYQDHKVDQTTLTGAQVPNLKGESDFLVRQSSNMNYLNLNQNKVSAFKNINVRRAFSLAIDRHKLVKGVLQDDSLAPKGFVPVGLSTYQGKDFAKSTQVANTVSPNFQLAKKLLSKGMREAKVKNLKLTLMIDDTEGSKHTGEFIQGELEKLPHVQISLRTLPKTQRLAEDRKGNYDMVIASWQSVYADPINFLEVWQSDSSYNTSGFKDEKFDHYLDLSENKYGQNPTKRWQAQQKAEKRLMHQQGTIPLYQGTKAQLMNSKVRNIVYNGSGVPYDWKTAYLK
ncbi:peptide ABC transporter substrate-binding protein [Bombilactobacillus thymidiniphilus]|uniref:Peptide ABC transporter substrate-binding protein n=1 Tax=Bombilactobacillus thymidiniphilus TaxID=2923363 RepID=A0ABY4PE30_9LACO|nr:peptide ABC transporter substrate-binding protein [Bombilactobacillus thymidiniphilus]UQS84005.1 peptide ABC transporter substrate-binding protein [Bombilactobacillus thymidiniphilus]